MGRGAAISCALAVLCLAVLPSPAMGGSGATAEEEARARELFQHGQSEYDAGRYEEALEAWRGAYENLPLPGFLFNLGQCYRHLGRHEEALEAYRLYLKEMPEAPNRDLVEELIAEVESQWDGEEAASTKLEEEDPGAVAAEKVGEDAPPSFVEEDGGGEAAAIVEARHGASPASAQTTRSATPSRPLQGDLGPFHAHAGFAGGKLGEEYIGASVFRIGRTFGSTLEISYRHGTYSVDGDVGGGFGGLGVGAVLGSNVRFRPNIHVGRFFGTQIDGGWAMSLGADLSYAYGRYVELGFDLTTQTIAGADEEYHHYGVFLGLPSSARLPYESRPFIEDTWFWITGSIVGIVTLLSIADSVRVLTE